MGEVDEVKNLASSIQHMSEGLGVLGQEGGLALQVFELLPSELGMLLYYMGGGGGRGCP